MRRKPPQPSAADYAALRESQANEPLGGENFRVLAAICRLQCCTSVPAIAQTIHVKNAPLQLSQGTPGTKRSGT